MNLLKSIFSIRTIMCIRLICGLYYKINSNRLLTSLSKMYCVFVSMIIITNVLVSVVEHSIDQIRLGLQVSLYVANVLVNICCASENFPALLNKLREIDDSHDDLTLDDEIPVSRILFIVSIAIRIYTHLVFCTTSPYPCFLRILAIDLMTITSHFTRIMMFESLWHRMKLIRKRFEKESRIRRWDNDEEITVQRLKKYMKVYSDLLNTTQLTNVAMKPLILLTTMAVFPKLLNIIHAAISAGWTYRHKTTIMEGLTDFTVSIASAAMAELINSEIDKLKQCFIKQLLYCRGETTRHAIEDAMMYFRQHPFKYTIWRLFTVDISMILSVVGLLTTYTVVMVQFSHFFN